MLQKVRKTRCGQAQGRGGPFEGGWGSQVKEKRVRVDVSVGQGWAELVVVRRYLAEQDKGTVDNKNDSKSTENYCKYLLR